MYITMMYGTMNIKILLVVCKLSLSCEGVQQTCCFTLSAETPVAVMCYLKLHTVRRQERRGQSVFPQTLPLATELLTRMGTKHLTAVTLSFLDVVSSIDTE
jgi:hypothetical protein